MGGNDVVGNDVVGNDVVRPEKCVNTNPYGFQSEDGRSKPGEY